MQLSQLYSNNDGLFAPIIFNSGKEAKILNVIFATVRRRKERAGDSHNLGKTTLIHLIDFLLLKDISGGTHFLSKHSARFLNFAFYLEIALHAGGFVTVRRAVSEPTKISFKRHDLGNADFRNLPPTEWDHWELALDSSVKMLDAYLDLRTIKPWDYRKGVSYFLRTQEDYFDYFQIQKFVQGKDREWKPYLACVLGLDYQAVHNKYLLDEEISDCSKLRDQKQAELGTASVDRGEVATKIDIARDEIAAVGSRLDRFDFREEERRINARVVNELEAHISQINDELYDLDSDIAQLERSVKTGLKFELNRVRAIFEESKIALSESLARSYEELVDFNRRLTRERNAALRKQMAELSREREKLATDHSKANDERQRLLAIIRDADTFRKYKSLQNEQADRRARLVFLETLLKKIDEVDELERKLRDLRKRRDDYVTAIEVSLQRGSAIKTSVTQLFNRYVKQVLEINGQFIVTKNSQGNLEFDIKTTDSTGNDTSQDRGHSYRRLLCALFDLSVLKALENTPFFHFVYHDGIFEGLDNRVKLRLLDLIHECIADAKVQYILSVIDSDLPRDLENDQQIHFAEDEIILTLHDQGDDGRLFMMPPF